MKLNPINQRRWSVFKGNKRARISSIVFGCLFFISLCAEFIANDKPILIKYKSSLLVPALISYPETHFGGDFDTEADYQDPYVKALIEPHGWMLKALIPYSYTTHIADLKESAPTSPDGKNWLGTDDQARDVLARIIYGFRVSVLFALALAISSSLIGIFIGAIQGFYGGKVDLFGQRFLEIWSGLPVLFILIILSSQVTPNFWWLLFIMMLFSWTALVDLVRAEFLRGRNIEYVKAAKALGASNGYIMFKHILPNALVATMTFFPFIITSAVATLTSLDFLGFGLPPGSASLGELMAQGKNNLHAPWLGISAFCVLALMLSLLVFIGEGIRDAFDPRLIK
ncbi:MAG: ABC transporter permease [Pseudomonadota bacterium]